MRHPAARAAALVVLLVAMGLVLWRRQPARPGPVDPRPDPGVLLVFSGEHLGEIEPCGCAKPQLGGILQRALLLRTPRLAPGRRLLVDAGNLVARGGRQQELKYVAFLQAMRGMGYEAAALGDRDLQLGLEFLSEQAGKAGFPLLAANLVTPDGGHPFEASAVLSVPAPGRGRLVVIGLLAPDAARYLGAQARVRDPLEAVRDQLTRREPGPTDRVLLLGTFGRTLAERLARDVGRPVIVIYGRGQLPPDDAPTALSDGSLLLGIGGKGRMLGALTLAGPREGRLDVHKVLLEGPEPKMKEILGGYQQDLAREDILGQFPRRPADGRYVGSAACKTCHAKAHEVWLASRHSRALESRVRVRHQYDPECVVCHVTGLERRGGFTSRAETPALASVSCESCHGPGDRHVAKPAVSNILRGSAQTCRRCHTADHDPHFDHERRWKRIAH